MTKVSAINRRDGLRAALALAVPGVAAQPAYATPPGSGSVIVVFMSRSGIRA